MDMETRVDVVLSEWRAAERELETAADDDEREDIEARVAALRDEYAAAVAANESVARELGGREAEPEPAGA
jgi:chromosome segregation ATPase